MARRSWSLAVLLVTACAPDTRADDAGAPQPDADVEGGEEQVRIVPEGLSVSALAGGTGVLALTALTLQRKGDRIELYAALKNVGDVPACSAAFSVELFGADGQSLAAGIGGLLTLRFYRRTDGSGTIAACVGPGEVTMTAVKDLPPELVIEEVRSLIYRCPYFALDVEAIAGVTIREVNEVQRSAGTAFQGTLANGLEVALKGPSVSVFALDRAGRPLGMASARDTTEIAPGGEWTFVTEAVADPGVGQLAFAAGELANR